MENKPSPPQGQKSDEIKAVKAIGINAIWAMFLIIVVILGFLFLQGCGTYKSQNDYVKTKEKRVIRGDDVRQEIIIVPQKKKIV